MNEQTEIVVGVGIVAILAAVWAWQRGHVKGAAASSPVALPTPSPFNPADYHRGNDVPNGIDLSGISLNYPVNIISHPFDVSAPKLESLVPLNMMTGTPQCGCLGHDDGADSFNQTSLALYDATLRALASLRSPDPMWQLNVNLKAAAPALAPPPPALTTRVVYFGTSGSATIEHIDPVTGHVMYVS